MLSVVAAGSLLAISCGDDLVVPEEGAPRSIVIVQGGTQTGTVGQPLPITLVVEVRDDVGRPVAQQRLTVSLDDGGSITPAQPTTDNTGRATFTWTLGPAVGVQQLSVATSANGPDVTFQGTASSATANVVSVVAGNGQSGQVGTALADSLAIQVNDQFGNPVADASVTWTTGGGSVSPVTGTTNAGGIARTRWTLGSTPGSQTVIASVAGVPDPVSFSATATAGPTSAALSTVVADSSIMSAGSSTTIRATIRDADGNPVPGITVTFASTGSGHTLQQPASPTDASGIVTGLLTATVSGPRTITTTAGTTVLNQTVVIQVDPGPPSPVTTDATVPDGTILSFTEITIRAADSFGNAHVTGGFASRFGVSVSGANTASPSVDDNGNGTYSARFLKLLPGADTVAVTLDGVAIKGSPYVSN